MKTKPYKVIGQIFRRGGIVRVGEVIELTDEEARGILTSRPPLIIPHLDAKASPESVHNTSTDTEEKLPLSGPELTEKLHEVFATLDKDNKELYISSGAPKTEVLEGLIGQPISAANRNEAWESFNKE
ncbi:hypothetical protein QF117_10620 [Vibrio sp. YMD68]|uniref:hypothetical protein n=1 Tax=Vibrio sp. YMD68 TaxID=3042300 RepID=UPI002499DB11|nr:hypothetical protein [Vibrio sp. YMD68]WGV98830.1 hypothetical protein QF117_02390 [Vibrio sp. YMD68]WGW01243.1 hypothetical protein QF117_10620 [Vibrio sp. YMD68]